MSLLRLYLLVGLIAHKVVWEFLKQQRSHNSQGCPPCSMGAKLIKLLKGGILLGIVVQTVIPEVLPITRDPLFLRTVGVTLYTAGLLTAVAGRLQLGCNWSDIETAQVLHNQVVVSHGVFRYIRHPIYIGDLLLLLGLQLSLNSWLVVGVGLTIPAVMWQAVREERMLVHALPGYAAYCTRTKRFIPFVV